MSDKIIYPYGGVDVFKNDGAKEIYQNHLIYLFRDARFEYSEGELIFRERREDGDPGISDARENRA